MRDRPPEGATAVRGSIWRCRARREHDKGRKALPYPLSSSVGSAQRSLIGRERFGVVEFHCFTVVEKRVFAALG